MLSALLSAGPNARRGPEGRRRRGEDAAGATVFVGLQTLLVFKLPAERVNSSKRWSDFCRSLRLSWCFSLLLKINVMLFHVYYTKGNFI